MSTRVYTAPEYDNSQSKEKRLFLAGTIDMGNSDNWQEKVIKNLEKFDFSIYNPRREKFDESTLEEQVKWELHHLDLCDKILMNILPESLSPISLMELGLYASSGKLIVCCPEDFYRYTNIKMVCEKYNVPLFNKLSEIKVSNLK